MIFQIQIRKTQDKSDIGKRFGLHTNYVPVGHWVYLGPKHNHTIGKN